MIITYIWTGTAGLGQESLIALSRHHPEHIYFTGRNANGANSTIDQIKTAIPNVRVTFIECDFTSLASVADAVRGLNLPRLDILMCNAGIMRAPAGLTKDGYEIQFGINHLAHALLIRLLLPTLTKTVEQHSDSRIIILTSLGFKYPPPGGIVFNDLQTTQDYGVG